MMQKDVQGEYIYSSSNNSFRVFLTNNLEYVAKGYNNHIFELSAISYSMN